MREEVSKEGTHPWYVYAASKTGAELEVWKFAEAHTDVDVTTSESHCILRTYAHD